MGACGTILKGNNIKPVPKVPDLVDIVLSKTQRKTPTEVHPQFKISRIRRFYMRKIKFAQSTFAEHFAELVTSFPQLDTVHPFYQDLCNVLYDRDHYKLALGQVGGTRKVIDKIAKDYVKLVAFADSAFKCKALKRSALGRMVTSVKKLGTALEYLEEVRQHISRLPAIDPNANTLLVAGFPNVGKSSFMNRVTNADVDVQPYAFTTKSLFLGHMDYAYTRWQVIDTPGILDRPMSERNAVEMAAITALAHIKSTVLLFFDVSEDCGFTIQAQLALYSEISQLFTNCPILYVFNKADLQRLSDLPHETQLLLSVSLGIELDRIKNSVPQSGDPSKIVNDLQTPFVEIACSTAESVDFARQMACTLLLKHKIEEKLTAGGASALGDRLFVAKPEVVRTDRPAMLPLSGPFSNGLPGLPASPDQPRLPKYEVCPETGIIQTETGTMKIEPLALCNPRQVQNERGGEGVFSLNLRMQELFPIDADHRFDAAPEVMDGRNVADFIDVDIEAKLAALLEEERKLEQEHFAQMSKDAAIVKEYLQLKEVLELMKLEVKQRMVEKRIGMNHLSLAERRMNRSDTYDRLASGLEALGHKGHEIAERLMDKRQKSLINAGVELTGDSIVATSVNQSIMRKRDIELEDEDMALIHAEPWVIKGRDRLNIPLERLTAIQEHIDSGLNKMRKSNKIARVESDRKVHTSMPMHLFRGKRGIGKTDHR